MNRVTLIGNLTKDPEYSVVRESVAMCRFSIAVSRNYKTADGKKAVDFFDCVAWRTLASNISQYCRKGDKICVVGACEFRDYTDRDGNSRKTMEVNVSEAEFLTPKKESRKEEEPEESNGYYGKAGSDVFRKKKESFLQELNDDDDIIQF